MRKKNVEKFHLCIAYKHTQTNFKLEQSRKTFFSLSNSPMTFITMLTTIIQGTMIHHFMQQFQTNFKTLTELQQIQK